MQEFNQLVRDLYEVRDGCVPSNVDDCVKSIAQDIMTATLQPFAASTTVLSDFSLYVNDFVLAGTFHSTFIHFTNHLYVYKLLHHY